MAKLTHKGARAITEPGMHGDGDGLWLKVSPAGARSWVLRVAVYGKRKEYGLGSMKWVSLADARDMAREMRKVARQGGNPETVRVRQTMTVQEAARQVHAALLPTWRNEKHGELWWRSLELHVFPKIGARAIESVGSAEVLEVLAPIWTEKYDTARRIRQRLAAVFDWAKTAGHYGSENPVTGVARALPKMARLTEHMAALPWAELPELMVKLSKIEGSTARMVEWVILTAARSGEARFSVWSEIENDMWVVPGERMKRGKEHRVPLCAAALGALDQVRGLNVELIFPSRQRRAGVLLDRPLSVNAGPALLKRMGYGHITLHGFRSTFRDWCNESARTQREVAEAALSHATGNAVERAYSRSDLFERRRALMDAWGRFCTGKSGEVVAMVRGA